MDDPNVEKIVKSFRADTIFFVTFCLPLFQKLLLEPQYNQVPEKLLLLLCKLALFTEHALRLCGP